MINQQLPDLTEGKTFFSWMTISPIDKLYAYGYTGAFVAGLIALLVHPILVEIEGTGFAYGLDIFAGLIFAVIFQDMPHKAVIAELSIGVAVFLCAITFFFGWEGYIEGFCVTCLSAYWGGYYRVYKKLQSGISS